jgi:hypothetical protein
MGVNEADKVNPVAKAINRDDDQPLLGATYRRTLDCSAREEVDVATQKKTSVNHSTSSKNNVPDQREMQEEAAITSYPKNHMRGNKPSSEATRANEKNAPVHKQRIQRTAAKAQKLKLKNWIQEDLI